MSGWRGLRSVWPAVAVCGGTFALVQYGWSNHVGVELVDIAGGLSAIAALALFCRVLQPSDQWTDPRVASDPGQTRVRLGSDQGQTTFAEVSPAPAGEVASRRDTPTGDHADRLAVPFRRDAPRLARRGADRIRQELERSLWQSRRSPRSSSVSIPC